MKTCNQIREEFSNLLDESIDENQVSEINQHLAGCTECARRLKEMQTIRMELSSSLQLMEVSSGFSAGLAAKLKEQTGAKIIDFPRASTHKIKPVWSKLFAYAAGFGIMAVGFVALERQDYFKNDAPLPGFPVQPVLSKAEKAMPAKVQMAQKSSKDSVKSAGKQDSLKHLKVVTPNEDKIYRVNY